MSSCCLIGIKFQAQKMEIFHRFTVHWAERSYSMFKVRRGSCEKIPLVQGKEQWLRFSGAAMKRYPTSKVRETQVRG